MKYFPYIIGCQMNTSDGERLANLLESHGATRARAEHDADIIVVVSCSVRQKAMDRIFGKLPTWQRWGRERGVRTVLTGCVLPEDRKDLRDKFDLFIEIKDMIQLPKLLNLTPLDADQGDVTNADYLAFEPNYSSTFQAWIPIMTGCNNYCTFCAVPYTRGQEASRPSTEIIHEVEHLIAKGYKEITLLGQNVNAYIDPEKYHDADTIHSRSRHYWEFRPDQPIQWRTATTKVPKDFAELLQKINAIPGDFWIRFLTSNPQDVSDELITTLPTLSKVTPYFHLPIQAGDNEVLRRMNRRHTREYYLDLIQKIRTAWPGVAISTDIIVGFPGETEEQFEATAQVMRDVGYDMAYLAEYSPRPGTAAQRFFADDVSHEEKGRRKEALNDILTETAKRNNEKLVGREVPVLVDSYDPETKTNSGKTDTFKTIHFPGENLTGEFAAITVERADAWGLHGTPVK